MRSGVSRSGRGGITQAQMDAAIAAATAGSVTTAQMNAAIAAAAPAPVSVEAKLRARSDAFLGSKYRVCCDDFCYSDTTAISANWLTNSAATKSTTEATSSEYAAGGDVIHYRRSIINPRTQKWHLAIMAKFAGSVGASDQKGAFIDVGGAANRICLGVTQTISGTNFSLNSIVGSSSLASGISTIAYDNNWHLLEAKWDLTSLTLSVDEETPVVVTGTATNLLAAGSLYEGIGNRLSAGITYVDLFYLASSRI